ncbi:DNA polymerase III subunit chi [Xenophilus arseniciresistens]|uniref:DNA polymerase III subunit chi n=1 Tax=Xenophilus arseniciresistens TaxID=1283306 RepID=A0AAE3NB16_9BURK|nr:DNA polymerase III subunit chi [Xenophilus arseniciresistens]MDA7417596.1 DNA polymerase III subunit chi [Xenophilus arseniciresistens]
MTGIDVHFNAGDKVGHACRLLRKAVMGAGAKVVVVAEPPLLQTLDEALWSFSPGDFIAHCDASAAPAVLSRSPVVLLQPQQAASAALPHHEVMVNLGTATPTGFERFERLIDVVGLEPQEREAGRERWRHYQSRGYTITRHDLGAARSSG